MTRRAAIWLVTVAAAAYVGGLIADKLARTDRGEIFERGRHQGHTECGRSGR